MPHDRGLLICCQSRRSDQTAGCDWAAGTPAAGDSYTGSVSMARFKLIFICGSQVAVSPTQHTHSNNHQNSPEWQHRGRSISRIWLLFVRQQHDLGTSESSTATTSSQQRSLMDQPSIWEAAWITETQLFSGPQLNFQCSTKPNITISSTAKQVFMWLQSKPVLWSSLHLLLLLLKQDRFHLNFTYYRVS